MSSLSGRATAAVAGVVAGTSALVYSFVSDAAVPAWAQPTAVEDNSGPHPEAETTSEPLQQQEGAAEGSVPAVDPSDEGATPEAAGEGVEQVDVVGASEEEEDDDDDDEDETCGFCIFMKGGPCKKEFVAWSKCVDEERKLEHDFTEACRDETIALQVCMSANTEYYGAMLEAEKAYSEEQEAAAALEAEDGAESAEDESASDLAPQAR